MDLTCIAIDDEPLALDVINEHASKLPFLNLIRTFQNPIEAISFLNDHDVDLIFLDIQMPDLSGFEFLKSLSAMPMVIFTTAYPDYALKSYDVNALDYLVKPIAFERFLKSVNKAQKRMMLSNDHLQVDANLSNHCLSDFIFVKSEYKTLRISLTDILFIESKKDYVMFQLSNDQVMSLLSIKDVERSLNSDAFMRVHRSFIISLNKIDEIDRFHIIMGVHRIPVGESYRDGFKKKIEENKV